MFLQGVITALDGVDRSAMLELNFDGGGFADGLAVVLSSRLVWIPWALFLIYYVSSI